MINNDLKIIKKISYANDVISLNINDSCFFILKLFKNINGYYREIFINHILKRNNIYVPEIIFSDNKFILFKGEYNDKVDAFNCFKIKELSNLLSTIHSKFENNKYHDNENNFNITQPGLILKLLYKEINYFPKTLTLIHGDITIENCLFRNDKLVCLIDFEEACLRGDPIIDIVIAEIECFFMGKSFDEGLESVKLFEESYLQKASVNILNSFDFFSQNRNIFYQNAINILSKWAMENNKLNLLDGYNKIRNMKGFIF